MSAEILRIARTESLFRDVNERIAEVAERLGADEAEFVCECADAGCGERFEAPLEEYEDVRSDGVHFLVSQGHERPEYERVISDRGDHQVIAKSKDVRLAQAARELDPRSDDDADPPQASEMK